MAVVYLFDEILLDPDIFVAGGALGGPTYSNTMARNAQTGIRKVNIGRFDFQQEWNIQTDKLTPTDLLYLMNFWGGGYGSGYGFRAVIVSDFYMVDEVIGTGNGVQVAFPIIKTYLRPGANHSYARRIIKPVVTTLLSVGGVALFEPNGTTTRVIPTERGQGLGMPAFTVKLNSTPTTAYTVDNTTGIITMTAPPAGGVSVKVSCEFDTPTRFLNNSFQLKPDVSSEVSGLQLGEILPAELGIT